MENPILAKKLLTHQIVSSLIEKRKTPRLPLRLPTEYFYAGMNKGRTCYTINISEGGVLLSLPEKMDLGQALKIEVIYFFDYELSSFKAVGEVVRVQKSKENGKEYECALEFVKLLPREMEKLKNFLAKIFY
jgi:c-di-GMP-binding flagellar brake protein YcgR